MDVIDGLSRMGPAVADEAVPAFGDALLSGKLPRDQVDMAYEGGVIVSEVVRAADVLAGNDEDMDRRLGVDILERDDPLVLVDDRTRYLPGYDIAEEAVVHFTLPLSEIW